MKKIKEWTIGTFLQETASEAPTPGGGSVVAISGALGSALVAMLGNLSLGREQCPDQVAIERIIAEAESLIETLTAEAEADITAYNEVMAAYRLPRESDGEKSVRTSAIQVALKRAAEVPLGTGEVCLQGLNLSLEAAAKGNPNVVSDAVAGGLLLEAALQAVLLNVQVNLNLIKDKEWKDSRRKRMIELSEEGKGRREKLLKILVG
jgi:Methenyl tetrahydrofolate cyclohydrolase